MSKRDSRGSLFNQPDLDYRLPFVRISLAVSILVLVAKSPSGAFFERHARVALAPPLRPRRSIRLSRLQYDALKGATILLVALWGAGVRVPIVGWAASASFAALNGYIAHFLPSLWSYNSHLNFHLAAATAIDTSGSPSTTGSGRESTFRRTAALGFMQVSSAAVYTQAGMSKLIYGRESWLGTGSTLSGTLAVLGTEKGRALANRRVLTRAASLATVAGELAILPAILLMWRRRGIIAAGATLFHFLTSRFLNISFWHLWAMFPSLFMGSVKETPLRSRRPHHTRERGQQP